MDAHAIIAKLLEAANEAAKTKHSCTMRDVAGILPRWTVSKHKGIDGNPEAIAICTTFALGPASYPPPHDEMANSEMLGDVLVALKNDNLRDRPSDEFKELRKASSIKNFDKTLEQAIAPKPVKDVTDDDLFGMAERFGTTSRASIKREMTFTITFVPM